MLHLLPAAEADHVVDRVEEHLRPLLHPPSHSVPVDPDLGRGLGPAVLGAGRLELGAAADGLGVRDGGLEAALEHFSELRAHRVVQHLQGPRCEELRPREDGFEILADRDV